MPKGFFLVHVFFLCALHVLAQSVPVVSDSLIGNKRMYGYKSGTHFSISPVYAEAQPFSGGLALVRETDYYTYINRKGEKIAKQYFVEAKGFSEGLAAVKLSTGWGFVNTHLNTVIPAQYQRAFSFSEGAAAVKKNKWKFINRKNEALFSFDSDTVVANFSNGAAIVGVQKEGWRYGLMSAKGKWLVPPQYVSFKLLAPGLFSAESETGYLALLNNVGNILVQNMEFIRVLNDTAFVFEKEGFRNVVDNKGTVQYKAGFKEVSPKGVPVLFPKWKLVDTSWKELLSLEADSFDVLEKVVIRHLNDKKQIVSPQSLPLWYESIQAFSSEYYRVKRNGKWTLMDKAGNLKWPFVHDSIFVHANYWWVCQNKKVSLLDTTGKPVLKSQYDALVLAPSGRLFFKQADTCGYFFGAGTKKHTTTYDSLSELGREFLLGWKNKQAVLLNDSFQVLSTKRFLDGKRPLDTLLVLFDTDSVYRYDLCSGKDSSLALKIKGMVNDTLAWAKNDTLSGIYHLCSDSLYHLDADTVWAHPDLRSRLNIRKGDTLALADITGKWQSSYNRNFRFISRLENDYLHVIARRRSGFADTNGFLRIATQYDSVGKPSQGYFAVKIKTKWGVVDRKERFVIHPNYSKAGVMVNGKIAMWSGALAMLVDNQGQELFNPRFHDIQPALFGYWKTKKGSNYGFLSPDARELLTPRFEMVEEIPFGYFIVRQYGRTGILNSALQEVWPLKEKEIQLIEGTRFFAIKQQ